MSHGALRRWVVPRLRAGADSREPRGDGRQQTSSATAGRAHSRERHGGGRQQTSSAKAEGQGSGWHPGAPMGAPSVDEISPLPDRRRPHRPPVRYFTNSQREVDVGRAEECPWESDDEEHVAELRPSSPIPWDEDSRSARAFRQVSKHSMRGTWGELARELMQWPDLCRLRLPDGDGPGAGYGLLHTLCTKNAPDWLTDWVLYRTPMGVLGFAYNEMLSGVPPLMGFDFSLRLGRFRSRAFLI